MPLHVHHAHRAELLVDGLAEVLREPPADPFAPEVIAVPSRGIERWVAQRLSHVLGTSPDRDDGVAAHVHFPFPGAVLADAVARASGIEAAHDPWRPERLMWPLLDVVDAAVTDGQLHELGPLAVHVTPHHGVPNDRRLASVRRVAELFDRYAVHRPAMLRAWASGEDADPRGTGLLPARSRWQPWLWRELRARLDTPSGPERLTDATAALAQGRTVDGGPLELELPGRLAVFGITALSATTLEVLAALAAGPGPDGSPRDVHLYLRHASPTLWRRAAQVLATVDAHATRVPATPDTALPTRDADPTVGLARDPLLAAWARDSRELQVVASTVAATWHDHTGTGSTDAADPDAVPEPPADATLLARLQEAIAHDRPREVTATLPVLEADDRSVQVHRCHGPARQVEVLHDVVRHLLVEDPDLEPRDVLVQCPDIETYAPLIEAVFAGPAAGADPAPDTIRVQLADRSLTRTNPLLRVLAEVLELADGRVTASAVLDLCAREPVRRRFAFGEDDLGTLEAWLTSVGVRWGLDGEHRDHHEVPTDVNTWRHGLDRLLAGVAAADERLHTVVGLVPEDDVEGDHVELAGRLAELLSRLAGIVTTFATPRPIGAWLDLLRRDVVGLLCAPDPDPDAAWQELGLDRALEELREAVRGTGTDTGHLPVTLAEVRDLLADRLAGSPSRAAHRTGDLTVCTLVPMRSVPHEVVIWLGMDDDVFPRRTVPDGDDLLTTAPLVGDRDPRTEDRQLLLDALLAARRRLVVLTTGHDERTGDTRPPAVPIGELLDAVDRTVRLPDPGGTDPGEPDPDETHGPADGPRTPAEAITTDHPLQGFDARRFTPGALGPAGRSPVAPGTPFGFDRDDLEAARAVTGQRHPARAFLPEPLTPPEDTGQIALADVVAFYGHPVKALLDQRLDVRYPRDGDRRSDAIPIEVSGLGGWAPGTRLLEQVVAGRDPERWLEVERARGTLPPGDLADRLVAEVRTTVDELVRFAEAQGVPLGADPVAHPVDVALDDGRRLVGSVAVVGDTRRSVSYSRLGRKHRLAAWIELLALVAADPQRPWRAVTLGRGRGDGTTGRSKPAASVSVLGPARPITVHHGKKSAAVTNSLGDETASPEQIRRRALEELTSLVALRDRGLCGPLLLPCETAGAYAETSFKRELRIAKGDPRNAAKDRWHVDPFAGFNGEDLDHAHVTVLGHLDVDALFAIEPEPEEDGPGWPDEPSRLGRLARKVWEPLLGAEEITDLGATR